MERDFTEDKLFDGIDFRSTPLPKGEYDNCAFKNCNFEGADLRENIFIECLFSNSNLSTAVITYASFREIRFRDCKILGVHFDSCNELLFSVHFEGCMLNLSSFYKLRLKDTSFINCQLNEVDFSGTNLTNASLQECDLTMAQFENTNLENTDFRSSENYSIHPELNILKKTRFSHHGIAGLLYRYDILID